MERKAMTGEVIYSYARRGGDAEVTLHVPGCAGFVTDTRFILMPVGDDAPEIDYGAEYRVVNKAVPIPHPVRILGAPYFSDGIRKEWRVVVRYAGGSAGPESVENLHPVNPPEERTPLTEEQIERVREAIEGWWRGDADLGPVSAVDDILARLRSSEVEGA